MLDALFKVSFTGEGQVGRMEWEERNGAGEHKTSYDTEKSDDDGFPDSFYWLIDNVQTEAKEKYVALVAQLKEKHGVKE